MNNILKSLLLFSILFTSCTSISTNSNSTQNSVGASKSNTSGDSDCKCTTADANRLANNIMNAFTQTQNQLPSDMARVINKESINKNDDCTWVASFKISWPFGNTDGAHPDEYITKKFVCNGTEIYVL
jgi:hypothetical protein